MGRKSKKKTICNICGEAFNEWDIQEDYHFNKRIGYGSRYDEELLDLHICIECMDKIIDNCKITPVTDDGYDSMAFYNYMPQPTEDDES